MSSGSDIHNIPSGEGEAAVGTNLVYKILKAHLKDSKLEPGTEIGIRIDRTLTQDAADTMAYSQFEAMGINEIKTDPSVSCVDHNTNALGKLGFPKGVGTKTTREEGFVKHLDEQSGASLKLTILNSKGRVWTMVGGGIASFTDVAATFTGIIQALTEYKQKPVAGNEKIYMLCGGPHHQEGLAKMRKLGQTLGVPIEVYGPETHLTKIVSLALQ
jgi:succinyl-CoA synthetase beta subunit